MMTFAALALATPIFGFALTPPSVDLSMSPPPNSVFTPPVFAQVGGGDPSEDAAPEAEEPADDVAEDAEDSAPSGGDDMSDFAAQLRQRRDIATIHRAFGIATWGAMLVTVVLGFIQYYNLYGFGGREDAPCVTGDAVFGQDQCWGIPWPHRIAAMTTTALYGVTFTLSFVMPDPAGVSEGDGEFAETLRMHKTLRWVHLAGMVAQVFLGFATAQNWFGIDRANDFDAQRALATVHQGIGWATFGVLTAAGAIMVF